MKGAFDVSLLPFGAAADVENREFVESAAEVLRADLLHLDQRKSGARPGGDAAGDKSDDAFDADAREARAGLFDGVVVLGNQDEVAIESEHGSGPRGELAAEADLHGPRHMARRVLGRGASIENGDALLLPAERVFGSEREGGSDCERRSAVRG